MHTLANTQQVGRSIRIALSLVASLMIGRGMVGQSATAEKPDPVAVALCDLVAHMESAEETPKSVVPTIDSLLEAIGDRPNAAAVRSVREILCKAEEWKSIDGPVIEQLFELTTQHRRGPLEYLAPAILTLSRAAPHLPAVQHARLELFGVESPIRDVPKAKAALANIQRILPADSKATPELKDTLRRLACLIGDPSGDCCVLQALRSYWDASQEVLQSGDTLRLVTASDLRAFQLLPGLVTAYHRGDRDDLVSKLKDWGNDKEQDGNPARLWLLAETRASLSDQGCESDLALAQLKKLDAATDPKSPKSTGWRFEEVRWVLQQFEVNCGDSFDSLRHQAALLAGQIRAGRSLPLVRIADYDELSSKTASIERNLRKRTEDLADKKRALDAANRELERCRSDSGSDSSKRTFDMKAARRREALADATRKRDASQTSYDTTKKAVDELTESLERHKERLASYQRFRSQ